MFNEEPESKESFGETEQWNKPEKNQMCQKMYQKNQRDKSEEKRNERIKQESTVLYSMCMSLNLHCTLSCRLNPTHIPLSTVLWLRQPNLCSHTGHKCLSISINNTLSYQSPKTKLAGQKTAFVQLSGCNMSVSECALVWHSCPEPCTQIPGVKIETDKESRFKAAHL